MTLVLVPPSSRKKTLLQALIGKLDSSLKVQGKVTYNGHTLKEFVPQRTFAYVSQHDVRVVEMTVEETLDFSAWCQGTGSRYELLNELERQERKASAFPDPDVDLFMKVIAMAQCGLHNIWGTPVHRSGTSSTILSVVYVV